MPKLKPCLLGAVADVPNCVVTGQMRSVFSVVRAEAEWPLGSLSKCHAVRRVYSTLTRGCICPNTVPIQSQLVIQPFLRFPWFYICQKRI